MEKFYFDSHGIGEIERIGEYSNFNISLQIIPRYIESIENFEIGEIRKIRG